MNFEYCFYERIRGSRRNDVCIEISDEILQEIAEECDDADEFEDAVREMLEGCEYNNVQDCEDDINDSDFDEHGDDFYSCINEARERFFTKNEGDSSAEETGETYL